MPVTIKTGYLNVKGSDGQYVRNQTIAEQSTSEQIADIESAGASQIAAINTKTTQSLASISDISELEGMISGVFNAANSYTAGQYVIQEVSGVNKLYRFTANYTANAGWSNASVVEVKVGGELTDLKSAINDVNYILDYNQVVTAEIEQYSINTSTGKNTTSAYTKYYRTNGFYKPKHIKATSTRGTLKTVIYFYSDDDIDTFISADDAVANLDADVAYPTGAHYVRVAGSVDGNPDDPLDLSAVTVLMTYDVADCPTAVSQLNNDIDRIDDTLADADIDNVIATCVDTDVPYNLIPSDTTWSANKQIKPGDGTVESYTGRYCSGYIPIDASKQYIWLYIAVIDKTYDPDTDTYTATTVQPFVTYQYAFYDANKNYVASASQTTDRVKVIPASAEYIRVTVGSETDISYARLIYADAVSDSYLTVGQFPYKKIPKENYQLPLTGYENFQMVCFGDSITHGDLTGNNDGLSYVDYASHNLNAKLHNVGFGGTTAARGAETVTGTGLFAFWNLCDCITSSDANAWDDLDAWASSSSGNQTYYEHLVRLKSIEWDSINAISILYGANDWNANIPVGSGYNTDEYKYDGAIAYGITKLLTAYPHLQIMILSPFYREKTVGNTTVSSDTANTAGLKMPDYAESLKNVQTGLHVTVVDSGNWGLNSLTVKVLTSDGTHPRTNIANARLGHLVANAVQTYLSPV